MGIERKIYFGIFICIDQYEFVFIVRIGYELIISIYFFKYNEGFIGMWFRDRERQFLSFVNE